MKKTVTRRVKAAASVWAGLGVLFLAGALAMFLLRDSLPALPRADIAYIGFLVVGAVFLAIAAAVYSMAADKRAMIEQSDERAQAIAGRAGNLAFAFQTTLVTAALFLLCFMGYASAVALFALMCAVILSVGVYLALMLYYRRKM